MAERAQDLEAAEMRTEEKTAVAVLQFRLGDLFVVDIDLVELQLVVEKIDAVEHADGEAVVVAETIAPTRLASEDTAQIATGGLARGLREDKEIKTDRIEQQLRCRPAEMQRDPDDEPNRGHGAALAARRPVLGIRPAAGHCAGVVPRSVPVAATSPVAISEHSKWVSPRSSCQAMRIRSPGRTGRRNLTARIVTAPASLPRMVASTVSRSSAPG